MKDYLDGRQIKNNGELQQVLIRGNHPAIVSEEVFERVNGEKL